MKTSKSLPLIYSLIVGACSFTLTSLVVFSTVAFAERWLYNTLGLLGAYVFWVILFVGLGILFMYRLVRRVVPLKRFAIIYTISFSLYATSWIVSYFFMQNVRGELVGSISGSLIMVTSFAVAFDMRRSIPLWSLFFFVVHSLGYFSGKYIFEVNHSKQGMILWGVTYGLGTGTGLGFILYYAKERLVRSE